MRILLFSGGIDSTCLAWVERPDRLVFVDYGQVPAKGELRACYSISDALGLPFDVLTVDLQSFGSGTLSGRTPAIAGPPEFWPLRNQMLITLAAMRYHDQQLSEIIIGTVKTDRQHADGRSAFRRAMGRVLKTQLDCKLTAPAANEHSRSLVARSGIPFDLLGWTFSCHTGEWACGQCNGCQKHSDVKARFGF